MVAGMGAGHIFFLHIPGGGGIYKAMCGNHNVMCGNHNAMCGYHIAMCGDHNAMCGDYNTRQDRAYTKTQ